MATVDLGKISFTQKGTYAGGTTYAVKDVVQYTDQNETSSFVKINSSAAGQAPQTNGTVNTAHWALFAKGSSLATANLATYAGGTTYKKGDIVQYTDSGVVSTYLYINNTPDSGLAPSTNGTVDASHWQFLAKGTASAGTAWDSTPKTANFTAVGGNGYWCDTSGGAFTCTLPAGSNGLTVELLDNGGAFGTNNLTITPNGSEKIDGATGSRLLGTNRQGIRLVYADAATGWTAPTGNANNETPWYVAPYNIDYVVVAGGGAGGDSNAGGGGAGGMLTGSSLQVSGGSLLTITVGAGGTSVDGGTGNSGANSVLSGAGIATLTAIGGGGGGTGGAHGVDGGSGGGNGYQKTSSAGSGTAGQGNDGGNGAGPSNAPSYGGGGGGGKGSAGTNGTNNAGGNGGSGGATSITGSSITLAGGGGGSTDNSNNAGGSAGSGGGGRGRQGSRTDIDATVNTGGGGGGAHNPPSPYAGAGGSGVVYIRLLTANYTGTTSGSPTVTTDGSHKVIKFTGSGTLNT